MLRQKNGCRGCLKIENSSKTEYCPMLKKTMKLLGGKKEPKDKFEPLLLLNFCTEIDTNQNRYSTTHVNDKINSAKTNSI
jgi:hypothetical protein